MQGVSYTMRFPDGRVNHEPDKMVISYLALFFGGNYMDLLKDNLKNLYFRFLIPSLGSAMVMSIYTLTDAIVIGKGIGADALAALSLTTPLLCILMSIGILFRVGGSVPMSVNRGTDNYDKANRFFTLSFWALAIIAVILWLIYGFSISSLLRIMGANDTLYPYAMSYSQFVSSGSSIFQLYRNLCSCRR